MGRFQLVGIPAAPRGVPQIEVSFDIDANGIVHVSATDKGTGKEQKITISSASGLSDDEIEKMRQEAESHEEEDNKKKESIEAKNEADTVMYSAEKAVKDAGDKMPQEVKDKINKEIEELKKVLESEDAAKIKEQSEKLQKEVFEYTSKM